MKIPSRFPPATLSVPVAVALFTAVVAPAGATGGGVEDVLVVRSVRVERVMPSTWCTPERAGFAPLRGPSLLEERFAMHAVVVAADGRIADPLARAVGELRACLGFTSDPRVVNFYAEGALSDVTITGSGDCLAVQPDHPEPGITAFRCHLRLRNLTAPYTGGLLTSSSLASKAPLGTVSDPAGYVQPSIATIRLWRAR